MKSLVLSLLTVAGLAMTSNQANAQVGVRVNYGNGYYGRAPYYGGYYNSYRVAPYGGYGYGGYGYPYGGFAPYYGNRVAYYGNPYYYAPAPVYYGPAAGFSYVSPRVGVFVGY